MATLLSLVDAIVVLLAIALARFLRKKRTPLPLPPGPKGWPLIGNLLDIPSKNTAQTYSEWGRLYGGIVYANAAGQPLIIINDATIANEMLDKKSSIYSDRPVSHMAGELAGFNGMIGFRPNNRTFKQMRKFMHQAIGTRGALSKYHDLFESEARKFLQATLHDPEDVHEIIQHTVGAIIILTTYGYQVAKQGDPIVHLGETVMQYLSQMTEPGAYLVDFIPALKYVPTWFPGAGFRKAASNAKDYITRFADVPFQFTLREMAKGTARPSFISDNMREGTLTAEEVDTLKWSAGSLLGGGTDTSVSVLLSFFLTMTLFPEVRRKGQEEIDRVVGGDRLPTLADRERLPYVSAIFSEILRWATTSPPGFPHRTLVSDTYRGYFIPKDSIVVTNIWQMLHDPSTYVNPEQFSPERFLETERRSAEPDPRECAFGFGRRVCPGNQFADTILWLTIAMSLSVLCISKVVEDGVEITPEARFSDGIVSHPDKFRCDIKPRSARAEALILQSP
ncbi:cytochrome P450 [Gloeopeniophorella convolvens]|nr:cytochrome P450 [Gloeopeniophorella convolvens]